MGLFPYLNKTTGDFLQQGHGESYLAMENPNLLPQFIDDLLIHMPICGVPGMGGTPLSLDGSFHGEPH